jgi:membrane protease YdiL (CAAX protease family)
VTTPALAPAEVECRPGWSTVVGLLVGIPATYWVKDAVTPWGDQLFDQHDQHAFYAFWLSVVLLHWASVVVCVIVLRRHRVGLSDLGAPDRRRAIRTVALPLVVGLVFVLARSLLGPVTIFGGTPFFGVAAPVDVPQRLVWVVVAITAGVCEEFVYRGVALTMLQRRGFGTTASVALATIPFALMHGPGGILGFPYVGTLAVVMSILYLRTRSLAPGTGAHALIDLSAMLT